ncbi:MAG: ankyrin repeat domain-containing protein [Gemmatimonadales bacterium]|nr:ankyrin repeat domain-containing protein [Gemmatimonadales bacterium]
MIAPEAPRTFDEVTAALRRGDFSLLAPVFEGAPDSTSTLAQWVRDGWFRDDPATLNEAATCACFLGQTTMVAFLFAHGADPIAGAGTGLNGLHWAANRGQCETVRTLLAHGLPLEIRNIYGGTVLGGTVWASVHEARPAHLAIIEALLAAGADVREAGYPSGSDAVDRLLARYGAADTE